MDWNAYRYVPVVALILAAIWLSHRPGDVPLALKGICKMLGKAPPASAVKRNPVWKRLLAFLCVLLAFALCVARADPPDFSPGAYAALPAWENPYVTSSNRLPARAVMVPCPTRDLALKIAAMKETRDASPFIMSLNGRWDFCWAKDPYAAPGAWTKIDVPSCWQLQGLYDPPQYCNVEYPHVVDPPRIMTAPPTNFTQHAMRNPTGRYKREFVLPKRWENRKTTLHFNGVASALAVKINGRDAGYSEDSRLPAEFDVTPFLKPAGETNLIEATVYRWCDGSYLEDQDFWRLSGIYRDVYLVSEPQGGVYDAVVETALSDDFARASVRLALKGGTRFQRLELVDPQGRTAGAVTNAAEKIHVANPQLWSCELPKLYTLVLLADQTFYAFNVGFRKVEIKDAVLRVNGRRILVKGVNRHEMNPNTGYALTPGDMRRDAELMKRFNVNAVRTCHYPDDPLWYDVCDRVGFWVVCEANVESHGMGYGEKTLAIRPDYAAQHVERGARMVATFRNHPSVIAWSMGNEAGWGENFREEFKAMKALDATRPVQYEGACASRKHEEIPETEIECPMYAPAFSAGHSHFDYAGFTAVDDYAKNAKKPHVLCEYAHAMGNSTGDFQDYWDVVSKRPSAQGGFVWDFADQALWSTAANNPLQAGRPPFLAYGGDFGDAPNANSFNCNGMFDALRNPHPGAYEIKHVYRDVFVDECDFENLTVTIRNGFVFRDLSSFRCIWQYAVNGVPSHRGSFTLRGVEAGESRLVDLWDTLRPKPPKRDSRKGERTLTFAFIDGARGEVARLQCREGDWRWRRRLNAPDAVWTKSADDAGRVVYAANGVEVAFDRKTGLVSSFRRNGEELFAAPPAMNFWRAPTDNDRGNGMADRCRVWREAGPKATCDGVVFGETNGLPMVAADYAVPAGASRARFVQTLTPEGGLRVDWTFDAAAGLPEIPRVGLAFDAPLALDCVCWYGLGPHENYRDRANSAWLGLHNATVGFVDGFARRRDAEGRPALRYPPIRLNPDNYVKPGEQGCRTGVRWLKIGTHKAPLFEIASLGAPFGFNAWPYPQSELEGKTHMWEMARAGAITFNVDADQTGVGGDNSWGAFPHDDDLLLSGRRYALSVLISAVPPGTKGAGRKAAEAE